MSQRESGIEKDNKKWPSASLFSNIAFTSCHPLDSQIPVARLEWILPEFLLYFSAGFTSKITFSEWQLNQFNNVQFYTVGTDSPLPLHTCNCRLLSGITRVCFNAELFSSPDSWGGMTPWEGHNCDSAEMLSTSPSFFHMHLSFVTARAASSCSISRQFSCVKELLAWSASF